MTLLDTLASIGVGILALMVIVNVWIPNTIYRYKHGKRDESYLSSPLRLRSKLPEAGGPNVIDYELYRR